MQPEETDVVVIGMGVGGEDVAEQLAEAGLHVTGVEAGLVGGECPYCACIPTKMMVRAAGLLAEARRIPGMAGDASVRPDWAPVHQRIGEEATDWWDDKVAVDRFEGKGGHFARGLGRITAPGQVTVDTADGPRMLRARRGIVIATGTEPAVPPVDGLAATPFWTNRDAARADRVPESLIVLGGGPVATELAQVFGRFGAAVTVVEALPRLLPNEEPEASRLLQDVFTREGIAVRTGARAEQVSHDGAAFTLTLAGGEALTAQQLLVATGRRIDPAAAGAAAAGLDGNAKAIATDARMRAGDGVWAVGDITGKGLFTHVAVYQAGIAVRDILGQDGPGADYRALPRATFTDPEIASVGRTEAQAREHGGQIRTGIAQLPSSPRGWIHKAGNDGLIKVIEDTQLGILVGATSAGPAGGEVLGTLVAAVHGQIPVAQLRNMMYAYPTFHRAIEDALSDLDRS